MCTCVDNSYDSLMIIISLTMIFFGCFLCNMLPFFVSFLPSCGIYDCQAVYGRFSLLSTFVFGRAACALVDNCGCCREI